MATSSCTFGQLFFTPQFQAGLLQGPICQPIDRLGGDLNQFIPLNVGIAKLAQLLAGLHDGHFVPAVVPPSRVMMSVDLSGGFFNLDVLFLVIGLALALALVGVALALAGRAITLF